MADDCGTVRFVYPYLPVFSVGNLAPDSLSYPFLPFSVLLLLLMGCEFLVCFGLSMFTQFPAGKL